MSSTLSQAIHEPKADSRRAAHRAGYFAGRTGDSGHPPNGCEHRDAWRDGWNVGAGHRTEINRAMRTCIWAPRDVVVGKELRQGLWGWRPRPKKAAVTRPKLARTIQRLEAKIAAKQGGVVAGPARVEHHGEISL